MSIIVQNTTQSETENVQKDDGVRYLIISNQPHLLTGFLIRDVIDRIICLPADKVELCHLRHIDLDCCVIGTVKWESNNIDSHAVTVAIYANYKGKVGPNERNSINQ